MTSPLLSSSSPSSRRHHGVFYSIAALVMLSSYDLLLPPCHASNHTVAGEFLAPYGLNITEVDTILSSEVSIDYGPPLTETQADELYLEGTAFEWDLAETASSSSSSSSSSSDEEEQLWPYILCNSEKGLSGNKRRDKTALDFEEAGVNETFFVAGESVHNAERTCWFIRTTPWATIQVYREVNRTRDYMEVQPYFSSLKMDDGTVQTIAERLANPGVGGVPVPGVEDAVAVLGLALVTCPGVHELVVQNRTAVLDDIIQFLTADGGMRVYNSSFFVQLIEESDTPPAVVSARMAFWSSAITSVVENTTTDSDGETHNLCLDLLRSDSLILRYDTNNTDQLDVAFREEADDSASPLAEWQINCVWYLVQGLALHPYICRMNPSAVVVPNPTDPPALSPTPPPAPTPSSSSSWNGYSYESFFVRGIAIVSVCAASLLTIM